MSDARVNQCAEAIASALYRTDFRHLGDTDRGQTTWFTRGEGPKKVRIRVERSDLFPAVFVTMEFLNMAVRPAKPGTIRFQCDTVGTDQEVLEASAVCVGRILQHYQDVQKGEGIAGAEARAQAPSLN